MKNLQIIFFQIECKDQFSVDEMCRVLEMSLDEMPLDTMSIDEMSVSHNVCRHNV